MGGRHPVPIHGWRSTSTYTWVAVNQYLYMGGRHPVPIHGWRSTSTYTWVAVNQYLYMGGRQPVPIHGWRSTSPFTTTCNRCDYCSSGCIIVHYCVNHTLHNCVLKP